MSSLHRCDSVVQTRKSAWQGNSATGNSEGKEAHRQKQATTGPHSISPTSVAAAAWLDDTKEE